MSHAHDVDRFDASGDVGRFEDFAAQEFDQRVAHFVGRDHFDANIAANLERGVNGQLSSPSSGTGDDGVTGDTEFDEFL